MNVIYLISRVKKGAGPINQALNILVGLNRLSDVHAILVTLEPEREGDSWLDRFKEKDIEIIQLNQKSWYLWACVSRLKKIIKDRGVDIVHSSGFRADLVNMMLCHYVKTVSTQRNEPNQFVERYPRWVKPALQNLHLQMICKMDAIVTCSKWLQPLYEKACDREVYIAQNCVDTEYFVPLDNNKKKEVRRRIGLREDIVIFLVMGYFDPRKNVGLIIEAFREIKDDHIRLLLIGNAGEVEQLKGVADGDERIAFLGKIENPLEYLQTSDFFVSSSLSEGLPNTVLEAMSCGIPCVLSDIEPHKELIKGTRAGVLFNRNDKKELVEAIRNSVEMDYEEMSGSARDSMVNQYGIDRLANNYLEIYNEIRNHHAL